jgi:hypothetical protein
MALTDKDKAWIRKYFKDELFKQFDRLIDVLKPKKEIKLIGFMAPLEPEEEGEEEENG